MFSNGKPVTAHDWVYTLCWSLGNGYDFAWFYFDIKNAAKVATGELPPEELGMEAVDDYTLRIYTEAPVPYMPMLGVWWEVMSENAQEELGENWALDPERFVSSGPFILTKFERAGGTSGSSTPTTRACATSMSPRSAKRRCRQRPARPTWPASCRPMPSMPTRRPQRWP